jgi:hypothetical protein
MIQDSKAGRFRNRYDSGFRIFLQISAFES